MMHRSSKSGKRMIEHEIAFLESEARDIQRAVSQGNSCVYPGQYLDMVFNHHCSAYEHIARYRPLYERQGISSALLDRFFTAAKRFETALSTINSDFAWAAETLKKPAFPDVR